MNRGYPSESHFVTTNDGYILEMHRIPYGKHSPPSPNKPAVFVMHCLLCSSANWIVSSSGLGNSSKIIHFSATWMYDTYRIFQTQCQIRVNKVQNSGTISPTLFIFRIRLSWRGLWRVAGQRERKHLRSPTRISWSRSRFLFLGLFVS